MRANRVCLDCGTTEGERLWHFCEPCEYARMKRDGVNWWVNIIRDLKAAGLQTRYSDRVPEKKTKKEETAEGTHQGQHETLPLFEP